MATLIERIRGKVGDKRSIYREEATGDGVSKFFQLDPYPVSDLTVWINGVQTSAYTLDAANGFLEFNVIPAVNDAIIFQYYSTVWTDEEIQDFLTDYDNNLNITAAHILLSWAADAARLAKRETRSGGGGLGSYTIDTSVAARELRNTASALLEWEREYGATLGSQVPADGITEIPWTEAAHYISGEQRIIRDD